ncbi:FimD family fimbriae anchoring protein [Trabulsiella guamensis ATCC 49490]|uniref:FimD family fimbriae anchoring protein n=1 Tax=Trabulsiella guamensis ATCC 49490 TaxID=1005994 RepID=A0A085ASH6_9ENTR|nr:fimbria/pilus outer membrane usher protein [Trabulsiella guamensis]KFC13171.1 FimD family fimbriae anchoring protein [Trabulsiella guamensis ATCC 49490]
MIIPSALSSHRNRWRVSATLCGIIALVAESALARDFYFSPTALEGGISATDLSIFSNPNAQLPGSYPTTVLLNDQRLEMRTLSFLNGPDGALVAQITPMMLRQWGVKVDDYTELAALPADEPLPESLGHYIPAANCRYNFTTQTLNLSLPQAAIHALSAGYVDPSRWDDGVPVLFTDYAWSGRENHGDTDNNSQYINLRTGANLGGWKIRNYSAWNQTSDERHWQTIGSWLQHDLRFLKAQFVAGQSSTRGDVFDSVQFEGINIASDEEMLPVSERGFAPVIRGIANSNAVVTVKQNGYTIYQANVAPGAFEISDIYASTNSGDLQVSVKEADGSEHNFTQPFSSVALMQRPQHWRFETTIGRYRSREGSDDREPEFLQASVVYGLNNFTTLYGGLTAAENYTALASGMGVNLGRFGALSLDVTAAHTELAHHENSDGQSWRLLYSSSIDATNTHLTLASYRYSTRGYYSFADANHARQDQNDWRDDYYKRNRIQFSISQPFTNGSLYLNGYQQNYWGTSRKERSLSGGMSYQHAGISYHLTLSRAETDRGEDDRMLAFGVSIPLNRWLANSWASYSVSKSKNGGTQQNLGLSGTLLEDRSLNYSLQQSHSDQQPADSNSLYSTWRSPFGNVSGGYYSASGGDRQISYGISGAIVAHRHGVTLSQPLGDQFAIVDTGGASGLRFQNQYGIRTDWAGNAIIPSLTAYQENRIGIDTTTLPDDVDSNNTAITVVPARNAAVRAHFTAHIGYRVLMTLTLPNGQPVPFGAIATVDGAQSSGIVDDGGVLYMAGIAETTTVTIKWGTGSRMHCHADIRIPASSTPARIKMVTAVCRQEEQ